MGTVQATIAQNVTPPDTTQVEISKAIVQKPVVTEEEEHSPKKAARYSAILPGLGQAYNKKYWKIPLLYIGFGTMVYFIDWNNDYYKLTKNAYIDLTDDDDETTSYLNLKGIEYYDLTNSTQVSNLETALTKRQTYYRRNRDLLIICMFGVYGLNIIDASVDAHFFNFEVSDDLSINWQPSMINFQNNNIYCVNFTINF